MTDRSLHASCAARAGAGVLIFGAPGQGKSDLLLRLIETGYDLVSDDRVVLTEGFATAPVPLRGLIELRGWGIVRMPYVERVQAVLAVELMVEGDSLPRLPETGPKPIRHAVTGLPLLRLHGFQASAVSRVGVALDCVAPSSMPYRRGAMFALGD